MKPTLNLLYRVAERAAELSRKTKSDLIDIHGMDERRSDRVQQCTGMDKGSLIDAILVDEFENEAGVIDRSLD